MSYLKINDVDFSKYVNVLHITNNANFNEQVNAAGNTIVDYINTKRTIEVGIIPLDSVSLQELLTAIEGFNVSLSFLNPLTGALEENVNCIIPSNDVSYYTIQANRVLANAFTLAFREL